MAEEPPKGWSAVCDDCGAITVIDGDGKGVVPSEEWDSFPKCLVCGSTLYFDETTETLYERENRLMQMAANWARDKEREQMTEQLERMMEYGRQGVGERVAGQGVRDREASGEADGG